MGFVIGPLTAVMFSPINFQFGEWKISQENAIGLFMAVIYSIFMVVAIFGVSNLPREQNLVHNINSTKNHDKNEGKSTDHQAKEEHIQDHINHSERDNECEKDISNDINESTDEDTKSTDLHTNYPSWTLKDIFKNFDLVLLFVSSAFCNYISVVTEILVNIEASIEFKWSLTRLGIITSIGIILYMISLLTFGKNVMERVTRGSYLACFIVSILTTLLLIVPELIQIEKIVGQTAMVCVILFLNTFTGFACVILAWKMLFQMVPEKSASYCEGLRSFFSRCFGVAAFLSSSWVSDKGKIVLPILACVLILLSVLLVARKRFRPRCFVDIKSVERVEVFENVSANPLAQHDHIHVESFKMLDTLR